MAVAYDIGTGIADVTDAAAGLPLQGMADRNQISTGVESQLYTRTQLASSRSVSATRSTHHVRRPADDDRSRRRRQRW